MYFGTAPWDAPPPRRRMGWQIFQKVSTLVYLLYKPLYRAILENLCLGRRRGRGLDHHAPDVQQYVCVLPQTRRHALGMRGMGAHGKHHEQSSRSHPGDAPRHRCVCMLCECCGPLLSLSLSPSLPLRLPLPPSRCVCISVTLSLSVCLYLSRSLSLLNPSLSCSLTVHVSVRACTQMHLRECVRARLRPHRATESGIA